MAARVHLTDFKGKWVVVETGSATCSMYTKNIPGMKELRAEFPDVEFIVVYVREAHPGERLSQHQSFEEKKKAASFSRPAMRKIVRFISMPMRAICTRLMAGCPISFM